MSDIPTIERQLDNGFSNLEDRVKGSGLILWPRILKKKFSQFVSAIRAKDKKIHGEATQLETLVKGMGRSKSQAQILDKIYKIKNLVGVFCLGMICIQGVIICLNLERSVSCARAVRRSGSQRISIQRVVHRREAAAC